MVAYIADEMEGASDSELHGILNHLDRLGGIVTKKVQEVGSSRAVFWWLTDKALAFIDGSKAE
jgi:hypothetical protein